MALKPGEALTSTAVRTVAEGQVVHRVALHQELIGVVVVARIAVARSEEHRRLSTGWRAAREGRGGDSGIAVTDIKSRMLEKVPAEEVAARIEARLADPDIQRWPTLEHVIRYPKNRELWFDIVMNELDGDWYEERNPVVLAKNIDIPVYVQINWGRGWTVDGSIELFKTLSGTKKIDLLPYPPMPPTVSTRRR